MLFHNLFHLNFMKKILDYNENIGLFNQSDKKCFEFFDFDKMSILDCGKIPVKIHTKLITNDSFIVNKLIIQFCSIMKFFDISL